ncbi:MAG TPA: NAD(P)-dependent oxidoreductase [Gaiellaceae bacterium]|jgi:nucleoside-diphosphate-sugar epimerase|nr:NAD(P)-dependent oxidoreductase [Gaiellaceae bacterium]
MARSAFILGGTGQIGRATADRLVDAGWDVTLGARNPEDVPGTRFVQIDRNEGLDIPGEYDALVHCLAMTPEHAQQMLALSGRVGAFVVVSTAGVYSDDLGAAKLPVPIPEAHPTVEPGDANYATQKRAMELALLEQDAAPVTIVRPCAIHGRHGKAHIREWYFVKRAQDGRPFVLLAYCGTSQVHTTSAANLGELIRLACEQPGTRVLNSGDPDTPTTLEISRRIAELTGHEREEHLLDDAPDAAQNPWAAPDPFLVDMAAAERELGYRPVTTYHDAVADTVDWLLTEQPPIHQYMQQFFDYEAEDELVRGFTK